MTTLSKQEKQVLEKEGYDLEFVEEVQPEGEFIFLSDLRKPAMDLRLVYMFISLQKRLTVCG